jgi:hypothetical protein
MKQGYKKPEINPLITKLLREAKGDTVAKFEGYVGPSDASTLRLYLGLDLMQYVDIPEEALLHVEEVSEGGDGRVRLWIRGSTQVQLVSVRSAVTQAARVSSLLGGAGLFPSRDRPDACLVECQQVCVHGRLFQPPPCSGLVGGGQARYRRLSNCKSPSL